jgi:hypothetical protein
MSRGRRQLEGGAFERRRSTFTVSPLLGELLILQREPFFEVGESRQLLLLQPCSLQLLLVSQVGLVSRLLGSPLTSKRIEEISASPPGALQQIRTLAALTVREPSPLVSAVIP